MEIKDNIKFKLLANTDTVDEAKFLNALFDYMDYHCQEIMSYKELSYSDKQLIPEEVFTKFFKV